MATTLDNPSVSPSDNLRPSPSASPEPTLFIGSSQELIASLEGELSTNPAHLDERIQQVMEGKERFEAFVTEISPLRVLYGFVPYVRNNSSNTTKQFHILIK